MSELNQHKLIKILICAMGGEGGGVLMNWIVSAAWSKGYPIQATSVPGVAQRTGATTYYIEMLPQPLPSGASKPVFALNPTAGEVDLLIATEAAEAARAVSNGFITPDRTHLVASTSRAYLMPEKMAMTDGRIDDEKLSAILNKSAFSCTLFDANNAAKNAGAIVNAVMLGAVAATDVIGIKLEEFIESIKSEGKAVEANLSGINMGFSIANSPPIEVASRDDIELAPPNEMHQSFPESVRPIVLHAINRLLDYQNKTYVETYLSRLEIFKDNDPLLLITVAKQLALRMTYEDIIRVAQAKVRSERFERIRNEAKSKPDDILVVTDFFKPGITEIADMLPSWLGRKLLVWGDKRGKLEHFGFDMTVKTTSVVGFLKLWFLAKLKWWRPNSHRWQVEHANIESWLDMVSIASSINVDFAIELADLARLIKGYGSTHRRGTQNYKRIIDVIVKPILEDGNISNQEVNKLRLARDAATKDPEGSDLEKVLATS